MPDRTPDDPNVDPAADPNVPDAPRPPVVQGQVDGADADADAGPAGTSQELHETALGRLMLRLKDSAGDYVNWILIALVGAAALAWALRLRSDSNRQMEATARQGLAQLGETVAGARLLAGAAPLLTADQLAERVSEFDAQLAETATLTRDADGPVRARAARLQGDYFWALATLPQPRPATRPAGEFEAARPADDLLDDAAAAYRSVVAEHADSAVSVRAALFGLAAVAEERGDFEAAGEAYDELLERDDLPPVQERLAEARRSLLPRLSTVSRLAAASSAPPRSPTLDDPLDFLRPSAEPPADDPLDLGPPRPAASDAARGLLDAPAEPSPFPRPSASFTGDARSLLDPPAAAAEPTDNLPPPLSDSAADLLSRPPVPLPSTPAGPGFAPAAAGLLEPATPAEQPPAPDEPTNPAADLLARPAPSTRPAAAPSAGYDSDAGRLLQGESTTRPE